MYALNIGGPKYIRKILEDFKKATDSNTFILGYFNTPVKKKMNRSLKQSISKDIAALNNAIDLIYLTDIYRSLHPKKQNIYSFQMHMEHFQRQTT